MYGFDDLAARSQPLVVSQRLPASAPGVFDAV